MARTVSITCGSSIASSSLRPSLINPKPKPLVFLQNHPNSQKPSSGFQLLKVNATGKNPATKPNSIVCNDCDGNGAILCTQCKGTGVNSVDHFNGQFKAGGLCWLCRGKKDILCGNCNGAGFIGGYLSTFDD